ncbi:hypothetical protein ACWEPB_34755 [Kitasatospora cineracea]
MADIWWKAHPHDLHRLSDRVSSVYVERSHIDRDENAVFLALRARGDFSLLADSGTTVCC